MSGGYFEYHQYQINDIVDKLEDYIYGHELSEDELETLDDEYARGYVDDEEYAYCSEHKRSVPNKYGYNKYTIASFKDGLKFLKLAAIYAQRIDWLMSGDDVEESFQKRLREDLEKLINIKLNKK